MNREGDSWPAICWVCCEDTPERGSDLLLCSTCASLPLEEIERIYYVWLHQSGQVQHGR